MTTDEVIRRLRDAKGQRRAIAEASGRRVSYRWINHVLAGKIKNPGSIQLDWLRGYFAQREGRQ